MVLLVQCGCSDMCAGMGSVFGTTILKNFSGIRTHNTINLHMIKRYNGLLIKPFLKGTRRQFSLTVLSLYYSLHIKQLSKGIF